MNNIQVSMTELRQRLGQLVNRAAYGSERIILVSHGAPKAAIIGVEDLKRLQQAGEIPAPQTSQIGQSLNAADQVRARILEWQAAHNITAEGALTALDQLRQERDDGLAGLR